MIKSKKIRESARGEACTLRVSPYCQDGETVVFCHLNTNFRGVGIKSPDLFGVYGCVYCHSMLDKSEVEHCDQLRALTETQIKRYEKVWLVVK